MQEMQLSVDLRECKTYATHHKDCYVWLGLWHHDECQVTEDVGGETGKTAHSKYVDVDEYTHAERVELSLGRASRVVVQAEVRKQHDCGS